MGDRMGILPPPHRLPYRWVRLFLTRAGRVTGQHYTTFYCRLRDGDTPVYLLTCRFGRSVVRTKTFAFAGGRG